MRGLPSEFGNDAGHIFFSNLRSHGRSKILCNENGSGREVSERNFFYVHEYFQETDFDIEDIRCALLHEFILHFGEHADEHIGNGFHGGFRTLPCGNHFQHFSGHGGIFYHDQMVFQNFSFLFSNPFSDILCHFSRVFCKFL